jgi:Rhs element Vgr protein
MKMTAGRKSAYFFDQTDADIISALLDKAGIEGEVEATSVTHKQQVQFDCTDWDFLVTRAEANGKLVFTNDNRVAVRAPKLSGDPVCTLQFGSTILELDAAMDARSQYAAVKSATWVSAQQILVEKDAADPGITPPGNVASDDLAAVAGLDHFRVQNASVAEDEAQAWADAQWMKSKLSQAGGRIKCEGIATVNPGDLVKLDGVGERFNGTVYVTGVRHGLDLVQGWKTHVQFGGADQWLAEETGVTAPKAGALLPGINGLQIGVVVSNEDPDGEHRVRVRMPMVSADDDGTWARVASPDAGEERGFFFRPEIGDEVVIGFLNDDPRQAIILGMLHSSAKPAPLTATDDNHEKIYQRRSQMKMHFNDDTKVMRLETPAGNSIVLSEEDQSITIEDQNGNKIAMTSDGIAIESAGAIELKAATEIKLESGTSLSAKGGTELKLEGSAGVELSSSAITKIKGSLVQIN